MSTESSENKNKICAVIKKFRLMKRMTAKDLSAKTGIAASNLSAIESGERVPKLDMCNKIANALEVDPVEICGLELTEQDEKRLLMKLLAKYATDVKRCVIGEKDGEPIYDPQGKSMATLPIEFLDFTWRYEENKSSVEFAISGTPETDPRYELIKANAEDEFNYWLDMYPVYDAYTIAKRKAEEGNYPPSDDEKVEKTRSQGVVDYDMISIWASIMQEEMNPDFWSFQSEYIIPNRNEAWRAKHTKKED